MVKILTWIVLLGIPAVGFIKRDKGPVPVVLKQDSLPFSSYEQSPIHP